MFQEPIKQSKLKTFKDLIKSMKLKTKQGFKAIRINPEIIFRRSIALCHFRRDLSLLTVLSKPTGGATLSLFHEDGLMKKKTKADLAHVLEEGIKSSSSMSVYVIDVIVLLHKTPAQHYSKTFGELVQKIIADILKHFTYVDTVVCVFHQYKDPNDVKAYEHRQCVQLYKRNAG